MSSRARPAKAAPAARLEAVPEQPAFDFLESKIRIPTPRPGTVPRVGLVNRLRAATDARVATVVAAAGYGKTTLLAQWAERDPRPFAWVTLDDRDNDPVVLLRHIAAALTRTGPVEQRVLSALRAPRSVWASALPRLAEELAARAPIVLVLDDFNVIRSRDALEAIAALASDQRAESALVLASRVPPRLPLASLRASGALLELGTADLALSKREALLLLRATGVPLSEAQTEKLIDQCEGWAAALYLAALSIRDGDRDGRIVRFRGDDRYLADYFRSEYLGRLRPATLTFLRRTSILGRMSGDLCDAVLQEQGAAAELEKVERANLFLVPLDNTRSWYRYHHLFHELLRRELGEQEPELVPVLHSRAADWFEAYGDRESALEHAFRAGDTDRAARILDAIAIQVYNSGRIATVEGWLRRFERAGLVEQYPAVALHGCRVLTLRGRADEADAWFHSAERADGGAGFRGALATLRAWRCRDGAEQMLRDADEAIAEVRPESEWRAMALSAQGCALWLDGDLERADCFLADAANDAAAKGLTEGHVFAVGQRALLAREREQHELADDLSEGVKVLARAAEAEGFTSRAVEQCAIARMMLRRGRWNEARDAVTAARELLPFLTISVPWLAVQIRLELAAGLVTLRDVAAARELLDEARGLLRQVSGIPSLDRRAKALARELDALPGQQAAAQAGLTPAELRLLPLLATHLSFREIADELFVSRNTIKTQAISVYRKLGVSSRSGAIAEAHRLGLGDHLLVVVSNDR